MAPRNFPGLSLTGGYADGENGWGGAMNDNLRVLSALGQLVALSRTTTLPGTGTAGDVYIVPSGAGSNANEIAVWDDGAWVYITPIKGLWGYVDDDDEWVSYDGTAWAPAPFLTSLTATDLPPLSIETQAGTTDTLADADFDGSSYIRCTSASAVTLTLDTGLSPKGVLLVEKAAAGDVTVSGTATINGDSTITTQHDVLALFPVGGDVYTGVLLSPSGSGGGGDVSVEDDGTEVLAAASTLNFTGAGVTVTDAGSGQVDIAIPGGGGGGGGGGGSGYGLGFASWTDFSSNPFTEESDVAATIALTSGRITVEKTGDQDSTFLKETVSGDFDVIYAGLGHVPFDTFSAVGVFIGDSTSTHKSIAMISTSNSDFLVQNFTGTSFDANGTNTGFRNLWLPPARLNARHYWRVTRVGTAVDAYFSVNGFHWVHIADWTSTEDGIVTLDEVGFYFETDGVIAGRPFHYTILGRDTSPQSEATGGGGGAGTTNLLMKDHQVPIQSWFPTDRSISSATATITETSGEKVTYLSDDNGFAIFTKDVAVDWEVIECKIKITADSNNSESGLTLMSTTGQFVTVGPNSGIGFTDVEMRPLVWTALGAFDATFGSDVDIDGQTVFIRAIKGDNYGNEVVNVYWSQDGWSWQFLGDFDSNATIGGDVAYVGFAVNNAHTVEVLHYADGDHPLTLGGGVTPKQSIIVAASDETSDLTVGTGKLTFRMPYGFTLADVRGSVTTAPTGAAISVDIKADGVSILSTPLTIDATEKTSTTAATPAVISDASLEDDAEITIDIDAVGSTIAGAGLKVALIGNVV